MPSAELTLQGRHLTRSFGQGATITVALRDVSLDLFASEVVLLMGPSGSGKSTLMAVLSGLMHPDRGEVLALGEDLLRMSDAERRQFRRRHCGYIFQGYNLFPALTAQEQLEMVVRWGEGVTKREARERVVEMLGLLDIPDKGHLLPHQLSGGEKQRVAIGRALLKRPSFCFADEPTSALDWKHGVQVVELLRRAAHERGATVLIVSHDARLKPYADQLYYLEDGRLVEQDAAAAPEPLGTP